MVRGKGMYVQNKVNMTLLETLMIIQFMAITTEIREFLSLINMCAGFVENSKEMPSCDTNAYRARCKHSRRAVLMITLRNIIVQEDRHASKL
jgi:hypothetical protein